MPSFVLNPHGQRLLEFTVSDYQSVRRISISTTDPRIRGKLPWS
jgi:hypothetical protein